MVNGQKIIDLNHEQDSVAHVDINIDITGSGKHAEIQGTAQNTPISGKTLPGLYDLAEKGI